MAASSSKYQPLTRHLAAQRSEAVRMKFADIERVLGAKLPPSARAHRAFWSNNAANNVMTQAWLAAGFRSAEVDLEGEKLTFRRATAVARTPGLAEAPAPPYQDEDKTMTPSLFGCMAGTVVINCDLTEPADPALAAYLEETYGPFA
jgi:hypothetical protein